VLRFLPPLIIEENELIFAFEKIENLFNQYLH
jgi:acetylornithine/succinyldiaminopimelate/putrescine aminotransferase